MVTVSHVDLMLELEVNDMFEVEEPDVKTLSPSFYTAAFIWVQLS